MRKKDSIGEDDNAEDVSNGDEYEEVTVSTMSRRLMNSIWMMSQK